MILLGLGPALCRNQLSYHRTGHATIPVARNWLIRNLRRIQFVIQEEQLYAECGARLKNFCLSNLLCICPSVFETCLNKAREGQIQSKFDKQNFFNLAPHLAYQRRRFGFLFEEKYIDTNSSTSNRPFFSCTESPCTW